MPRFVDAQAMHKKHPTTFEVPSAKSLGELKAGDHVKVAVPGERFWVLLTKVSGSKLEGTVDNNLTVAKLKYGAKVKFATKNVYSTMPKKGFFGGLFSNPTPGGIDWTRPHPNPADVRRLMR